MSVLETRTSREIKNEEKGVVHERVEYYIADRKVSTSVCLPFDKQTSFWDTSLGCLYQTEVVNFIHGIFDDK